MPEQAGTTWSDPFAGVHSRRAAVAAEALSAVTVLALVALASVPWAWIWSRLAPGQRMRVMTDRGDVLPLQLESWHRFDGLAIFLLLGLVAGVLIGTVVWWWRRRRGPVMLLAAVGGAVAATWLAMVLGSALAQQRFPVGPLELGAVIERAPELESPWALVAAPLTTALTYGALAAWNGEEDLGRGPG